MNYVLFSGGMDSTVVLFAAMRDGPTRAISIDYGQRHARELRAAERIAQDAGVERRVLSASIPWPAKVGDVLPGRNLLLLTLAASSAMAWSQSSFVRLWVGFCGADDEAFPDCRAEFVEAASDALSKGLGGTVEVVCPLMRKTKAETVRLARELGAWGALSHAWTCYEGGDAPCGSCSACRLRSGGFVEAGEVDPWRD